MRVRFHILFAGLFLLCSSPTVFASVPSSVDIVCDVKGTGAGNFKPAAKNQT
jgi:hypothetical protein